MRPPVSAWILAWLLLSAFLFGFACSRIHDSERTARMWGEARQARDAYTEKIMHLERLPGVHPEDRCRMASNSLLKCSDGTVYDLTD